MLVPTRVGEELDACPLLVVVQPGEHHAQLLDRVPIKAARHSLVVGPERPQLLDGECEYPAKSYSESPVIAQPQVASLSLTPPRPAVAGGVRCAARVTRGTPHGLPVEAQVNFPDTHAALARSLTAIGDAWKWR
jgi:hypothetical protein